MIKIFGGFLTILFLLIVITLLTCIPVWLLWNWLMPTIFGLKTITLIQSWGLVFLCNLLFKTTASNKKEN